MNLRLMTVTASLDKKQARILITGSWLDQFGFLPETLVTVSCQEDVLTMKACGIGLDCYRQVVGEVRQRKQHLIQVFNWTRKKEEAHLLLEGAWLERQGFCIGDILLAHFDTGQIRLKRLSPCELGFDSAFASFYKTIKVQRYQDFSKIILNAEDIGEIGFVIGQSAMVHYDAGLITLIPSDGRKQRRCYGIPTQVNIFARKNASFLELKGLWLSELGFCPGDLLVVKASPCLIQIRRLEDRHLSF